MRGYEMWNMWKERLKTVATMCHAEWPQYRGYFDNWVLARATKTIRYKGASILAEGRYVLAHPSLTSWYDPDANCECVVYPNTLRLIAE